MYAILNLVIYVKVNQLISLLPNRYYVYTEFDSLRTLQVTFNNVIAILVFISWIKLLKFLKYNVVMLEFNETISRVFNSVYLNIKIMFFFLTNEKLCLIQYLFLEF